MIRELWMTKYDQLLALFEEHQQDISLLHYVFYSVKDIGMWYSESEDDSRILDDEIWSLTSIVRRVSRGYFTPSAPISAHERYRCVIFWKWRWFENSGWRNTITHWHCSKSISKIFQSFSADTIPWKI